jgi:hypothetical protein
MPTRRKLDWNRINEKLTTICPHCNPKIQCAAKDGVGTDPFHDSLEEAFDHVEHLYGVDKAEWAEVNVVFGSDKGADDKCQWV